MFQILHRVYVLGWVAMVVGGALWLYPRTGLSEPLLDWYEVIQNAQGTTTISMGNLSGEAVRVVDGTTFMLRTSDRQLYSIGLVGAIAPPIKAHPGTNEVAAAESSRARLSELILSNRVEVVLASLDPQHRGLGIVRSGELNVNATMIEAGLVTLKRDFIKGLPLREQYALIRADRKLKERRAEVAK
jgi:endonuclease YncB( thermonuclease family)